LLSAEEVSPVFNSNILDVVIGLIFVFLSISLAVSATVEGLASLIGLRSRTLLGGIKRLLNDVNFDNLALAIYNHALANPLSTGDAAAHGSGDGPSYIHPDQFADAFIDVTEIAQAAPAAINEKISAIRDKQIRELLMGISARTGGDLAKMRNELAGWFDNAMDRVSGVYKRYTQLAALILALLIAGGLNVSAVDIGEALWYQPTIVRAISPKPDIDAHEALDQLGNLHDAGVPVGWTSTNLRNFHGMRCIWTIMGWMITAVATLFGAPFWFDALQQIVRLKGSGPSPAEKRAGSGAAA
jgi:hypothetical protein